MFAAKTYEYILKNNDYNAKPLYILIWQHLASRKHMEKLSRKMGSSNGDMGETCSITEVTGRSPNKANMVFI